MKKICILILSFAISSTIHAGGPWPQPKGKAYLKLYEWWINFDQHYTTNGDKEKNFKSSLYNSGIYGEYGLSDRFTTIFNIPFVSIAKDTLIGEEGAKYDSKTISIGDSEIGLKYGLFSKEAKIPVSISLIFGLPTGNRTYSGNGDFSQLIQIDAGISYNVFNNITGFTSVLAAFNNRTNGYSDETRYGIVTGLGFFSNNLIFTARFYDLESLHNSTSQSPDFHPKVSIFENNTEYSSYSFELAYFIYKGLGVSANYASAFRGEWIAAAPAYSVGLFYDFNR